ncbi:glycoside hydrolase family 2 protein [Sphingobacterium spiritivorum]|uniref:glycoside hydrolase family 2 protein n=1 Tax=Sphingobacterium spiritivorum TaxID=258 RepID=UPI003DA26BCA
MIKLKHFYCLLLLTILSQTTFAREVIPFNKEWSFKKGPFTTDPLQYADIFTGKWQAVSVPHTWNAVDMQTVKDKFYTGDAYYRKAFKADASWKGKRVFIRFEGVNTNTEVYLNTAPVSFSTEKNDVVYNNSTVNGKYNIVGRHNGGYSAFTLELTDMLKYGQENEILVKVNNEARPDVIPVNHTLFPMYGGIYRPVALIVTEKVNIAVNDFASPGIYIRQENVSKKSADVEVKVKLENKNHDAQKVEVVTTVFEKNGTVKVKETTPYTVLPQGRQQVLQHIAIRNPHLWQGLEDPYLYKLVTQVVQGGKVVDEVIQPLGLRHFELKAGDGMYLNGIKTPMYGVTRHQDHWGKGSALSNADHDKDLAIIKEIGATTIRLAHYQQSEYFYAKCDSIGFIIWAEIPFVNRVTTQEENNAKQQLTELIRQNFNHPSIYVWGLHNEVYSPQAYTIELTTKLNDLAKTEDPDRYSVQVSGYNVIDHPVNNNADIQGINHYFGWYNGKIQDVEQWADKITKDFAGYKIIFSEYGAEANPKHQQEAVGDIGNQWSNPAFFPEEFSTKFHEIHWGVIAKHPVFVASYLWNTFDFATPITFQVEPRNYKGMVTFDRALKKDPFYWYKANWSKEPVLYLTQRRVVERGNQITPVTVYSNVGNPQLFVNGEEVKTFRKGYTDVHYIFEQVKLKEGENIVEVKGQKDGKTFEDKITWHYAKDNAKSSEKDGPKSNKSEHIGL